MVRACEQGPVVNNARGKGVCCGCGGASDEVGPAREMAVHTVGLSQISQRQSSSSHATRR